MPRRNKKWKVGTRYCENESEFKCYQKLKELVPRELVVEYETEDIPYTIHKKYKPDFPIRFRKGDGTHCYIEFKGNGRAFSREVRQKMIAVKEQNPDKTFFIVFYADGKCGPKRKNGTFMKQSDWATKYGFEFCIGADRIPEKWFN